MLIDVVGGGSIGLLLSARLAGAGFQVNLWTRTEEQAELINEHGLKLLAVDGSVAAEGLTVRAHCLAVRSQTMKKFGQDMRWLLLCVKQTQLSTELALDLQELTRGMDSRHISVIALQNGFGHLQWLSKSLPECRIYAAITTEGARKYDAYTVQHTGTGEVWISETAEGSRELQMLEPDSQILLANMLQKAGISAYLSNDMYNRMLQKLLVNAVINPLTAIFDVPNGELLLASNRISLMKTLYEETSDILQKCGLGIDAASGWEMVVRVCELTASNISSMLSDVRAGRTTEIAAINGAVIELAHSAGVEAPVNKAVAVLVESFRLRRE
ncbi:ketopantoate reductase family protein [Paenibacillus sp. GXUN7292]|uniref:ketopantoate reductase family protein n=1 Tax=Paenibacillus sp. GXUN7292 TaxID=3422499 RepID=UPI003D7CE8B9